MSERINPADWNVHYHERFQPYPRARDRCICKTTGRAPLLRINSTGNTIHKSVSVKLFRALLEHQPDKARVILTVTDGFGRDIEASFVAACANGKRVDLFFELPVEPLASVWSTANTQSGSSDFEITGVKFTKPKRTLRQIGADRRRRKSKTKK